MALASSGVAVRNAMGLPCETVDWAASAYLAFTAASRFWNSCLLIRCNSCLPVYIVDYSIFGSNVNG